MKNFIRVLIMMFLSTACTGIQTLPEAPKALVAYEAPDWVVKGSGAYSDDGGKAFFGIGSATGIKNYSLQRTIADDRARGDLAKVFEFYVASLTKGYQASTTAGDFKNSNDEQEVEVALKVVVHSTLHGVTIIDHFEIPERRELLSLARLDYDAFKRNVDTNESFKQLPEEMREVIKERADKLHEEMEQEVEDLFTEDKKLF